ncbi:hypothetical protein [Myxococcus stipitatus]|uniref:hypothetical protein n=1 Tax=Myxococcus stipitatus TaxID=83455 RepID=UPI0030D18FD0
MTSEPKKLIDQLPKEDRPLYSLNFLVARFAAIEDLGRDEELQRNKLPCGHYDTRDYSTHPFHKRISTPLSRIPPSVSRDE